MITKEQAHSIVLQYVHSDQSDERFVIQSCEPSPRGDYWVIRANTERYVVHGALDHCHVGVAAYLVSATSGAIETVGSSQSWQDHLQDTYDLEAASGMSYVLEPAFGMDDKAALLNLRQQLSLSLQQTKALLTQEGRQWLTGRRRVLQEALTIFLEKNVEVAIVLREDAGGAVPIDEDSLQWDRLTRKVSSA